MAYTIAGRRAMGRAVAKVVFTQRVIGENYVGGGITVTIPELAKVYAALVEEVYSGYVAKATGFSGNAFKLMLFYLPDPTTYSGTTGVLTEVASGTAVSGITVNIVAIGE